ncbi:MAG: MotA/TolQ/ExbB proton channel family protein [Desulfobacterales bacterium]
MVLKVLMFAGLGAFFVFTRDVLGDISIWTNLKSGLVVLGGTLISGLLAYSPATFMELVKGLKDLRHSPSAGLEAMVVEIKQLARIRRRQGPRQLGLAGRKSANPFIRKGVNLILDEYDRYEIYNIMEKEYELYFNRRESQVNMLNTLAKLAPAFGFAGTIMGLINVLQDLADMSRVGQSMGLALLTTLYGLLLANFIFMPLARKFSAQLKQEAAVLDMVLEGIMDIADGKNPLAIAHRLQSSLGLHPEQQKQRAAAAVQSAKGRWGRWLPRLKARRHDV